MDEDLPRRRDDLLDAALKQSLDPLSRDELVERITLLEQEIARTRAHIAAATGHMSSAEALFRKG